MNFFFKNVAQRYIQKNVIVLQTFCRLHYNHLVKFNFSFSPPTRQDQKIAYVGHGVLSVPAVSTAPISCLSKGEKEPSFLSSFCRCLSGSYTSIYNHHV